MVKYALFNNLSCLRNDIWPTLRPNFFSQIVCLRIVIWPSLDSTFSFFFPVSDSGRPPLRPDQLWMEWNKIEAGIKVNRGLLTFNFCLFEILGRPPFLLESERSTELTTLQLEINENFCFHIFLLKKTHPMRHLHFFM